VTEGASELIVKNYKAARRPEYKWREVPNEPAGPGSGILSAYLG
jgi:hypothetical protein